MGSRLDAGVACRLMCLLHDFEKALPEDLSRYFRQSVEEEAEVQYAQG